MKKKAVIHRIVTPDHFCPWGLKALDLLKAGSEMRLRRRQQQRAARLHFPNGKFVDDRNGDLDDGEGRLSPIPASISLEIHIP